MPVKTGEAERCPRGGAGPSAVKRVETWGAMCSPRGEIGPHYNRPGDTRRLKLAALCQFTLPHPPTVLYGREVGLSQERDVGYNDGSGHPEESRRPMWWGDRQNQELLSFYRALIALRRARPNLWRAPRRTLVTDDQTGLDVYRCRDDAGETIVAPNNGGSVQPLPLDAGPAYQRRLASDRAVRLDGESIALPPYGGAVLDAPR